MIFLRLEAEQKAYRAIGEPHAVGFADWLPGHGLEKVHDLLGPAVAKAQRGAERHVVVADPEIGADRKQQDVPVGLRQVAQLETFGVGTVVSGKTREARPARAKALLQPHRPVHDRSPFVDDRG